MNSENETSQTTPTASGLNPSSPPLESSPPTNTNASEMTQLNGNKSNVQEDFQTQPLTLCLGQAPKLMEEMSDDELRAFLQQVQTNRASSQTFRAALAAKAEKDLGKVRQVETVEGFEELL